MSKKDLERGEANHVAPGATVFEPNDDSHVSTSSPIQLKARELAAQRGDETYRTAIAPDINERRQKQVTRKRIIRKDTKPI